MSDASGEVTRLLGALRAGDAAARDDLFALVYERLHEMARGYMGRERPHHSLRPTDLLHEAVLRLLQGEVLGDAPNRAYFFAAASRAMRQVLAEHARGRGAAKRGGGAARLPLDDLVDSLEGRQIDLVAARDALDALAARHDRASQVLTLRLLGGFTAAEVAGQLGVSLTTVEKDTRFARAWLKQQLGESRHESA